MMSQEQQTAEIEILVQDIEMEGPESVAQAIFDAGYRKVDPAKFAMTAKVNSRTLAKVSEYDQVQEITSLLNELEGYFPWTIAERIYDADFRKDER